MSLKRAGGREKDFGIMTKVSNDGKNDRQAVKEINKTHSELGIIKYL